MADEPYKEWYPGIEIAKAAIVEAGEGAVLSFDVTFSGKGYSYKLSSEWTSKIVPSFAEVEGYNDEWSTVYSTESTITFTFTKEDIEFLSTTGDGNLHISGAGDGGTMIVSNVTLTTEDGDEGDDNKGEWINLLGDNSIINNNTWGPAPLVKAPGDVEAYSTDIQADCANPWDAQLFIVGDQALVAGDKIHVSFKYYCTDSRTIETQSQANAGQYIHYECIGNLDAAAEWKTFDKEITVTAAMAEKEENGEILQFKTIAFNLGTDPAAATFYIADVVFEKYKASNAINDIEVVDNSNAPVEYFNLQGVKVNIDNAANGIYVRRQGTEVKKVLIRK